MRVIAHIAPGPSWLTGRPVVEQGEPIRAHLRFMQTLFDDGTLLLGGPARDGMSGLAVLEVPDLATARELASADPGVVADVLVYDVQELVAFFDTLAPDSVSPGPVMAPELPNAPGGAPTRRHVP